VSLDRSRQTQWFLSGDRGTLSPLGQKRKERSVQKAGKENLNGSESDFETNYHGEED